MLCPVSTWPVETALDFELFPRLLWAVRDSEGTALCDARRADVLLHLVVVGFWDAVSVQN